MHDAPGVWIERVAPMDHASIVPHENVADPPLMAIDQLGTRAFGPQQIEQGLALTDRQLLDVPVGSSP